MSDRVAVIGGNVEGKDHFPFGNHPDDPGANLTGDYTFLPLDELDLETACKWFYKVRWWGFTLSIDYNVYDNAGLLDYSDSGNLYIEFAPEVFDGTDVIQMSREADVVHTKLQVWNVGIVSTDPSSGTGYRAFTWSFPSDITNGDGSLGDTALQIALALQLRPFFKEDQFYFYFSFGAGTSSGEGGSIAITTGELNGSIGSINFDGHSVPIGHAGSATVGEGNQYVFTSITASFLPVEYWAYATKAGLPVYNTTTGAILNNPLS